MSGRHGINIKNGLAMEKIAACENFMVTRPVSRTPKTQAKNGVRLSTCRSRPPESG